MPLYNHSGDPMPLLSEEDKLEVMRFSGIYWERDQEVIFHMAPSTLKRWIHQLNPREALIIMSTHGICQRLEKQLSWKRWTIATDWLWRLWHG